MLSEFFWDNDVDILPQHDKHHVDENLVKQLYDIYISLYYEARELIKQHNPCGIHMLMKNDINRPVCNSTGSAFGSGNQKGLCCSGCEHLGPKGCTVKALTCSTWFCEHAKVSDEFLKKRNKILKQVYQHNFYIARGSEADSIYKAYITKTKVRETQDVKDQIKQLVQSYSIKQEIKLHFKKLINGKIY